MSFAVQIILLAVGTYLMRASVILLAAGREIPPRAEATLRLIPAAVLPALVAEAVAFEGDAIRPLGPWYVALAIAVAVAAWRRSVGWTLVLGMASLWVLEAIW